MFSLFFPMDWLNDGIMNFFPLQFFLSQISSTFFSFSPILNMSKVLLPSSSFEISICPWWHCDNNNIALKRVTFISKETWSKVHSYFLFSCYRKGIPFNIKVCATNCATALRWAERSDHTRFLLIRALPQAVQNTRKIKKPRGKKDTHKKHCKM